MLIFYIFKSLKIAGIHPIRIADGFEMAAKKCIDYLETLAVTFPIEDKEMLIRAAETTLGSKMCVLFLYYLLIYIFCMHVYILKFN